MNYLSLYLNTSTKDYDEDNTTVFYLTQDIDFTGRERIQKTSREKRYETRFEAALVNVGEAVVFISEFLNRLTRDERSDINATIYLRNDIFEEIYSGEHFDIYEMLRFIPNYKTIRAKILLNYGDVKIKWFDKIVDLAKKNWIRIEIANTTERQYNFDKKKLNNFRAENNRQTQARETRQEKGIEFVFKHLKGKDEKETTG